MAAKTARDPRRMTCVAGHVVVRVSELRLRGFRIAPRLVVLLHRLGISRLLVVVGVAGRDGVDGLLDLPTAAGIDDGILNYVAGLECYAITLFIEALFTRRRARGHHL